MRFTIALPDEIREQVQGIAIQKERVKTIIMAVMRYIAEEQHTGPSQGIPQAQRLYQGSKDRLGQQ